MAKSSADRNLVEVLAEEFVDRYRNGERPAVGDYCDRYPEHADEIQDLFPALLMMEDLKPREDDDPSQASPETLAPNLKRLGDFRILREVGRGGMGVVYEAEQVSLGRRVALKVLPQDLLRNAKQKHRFAREAKAAAKLHHTNIVPVFGVGEEQGVGYYVMQFIQGLGLDEVLEELKRLRTSATSTKDKQRTAEQPKTPRGVSASDFARSLVTGEFPAERQLADAQVNGEANVTIDQPESSVASVPLSQQSTATGRLSDTFSQSDSSVVLPGRSDIHIHGGPKKQTYWHSVAQIGIQVASALEYAHGQGVQHRDIKPANLLLDTNGAVWVTDFGLAKVDDDRNLTHTGDILGTLRYMPPEAFEGQTDARGDIYSLGLTLYELLTLQTTFDEHDRARLIKQVTTQDPARLEKVNREIPRDLATIVHKAIAREPTDRYATAAEFEDDLRRFYNDQPIRARRISLPERSLRWCRRNPWLAAATSLAIVAMIASTMFSFRVASLQSKRANEQRQFADEQAALNADLNRSNSLLEDQNERAELNLYVAHLSMAQRELARPDGRQRSRNLLDAWIPRQGEKDRRGWEWYLLHPSRRSPLWSIKPFYTMPYVVEWSPDGEAVAVGTLRYIKILDARSGHVKKSIYAQFGWVASLAWDPSSTRLAATGSNCVVQVFDVQSGALISRFGDHSRTISTVRWNPEGTQIATASSDQTARVWDVESGELLKKFDHERAVSAALWNPQGTRFATAAGQKICVRGGPNGEITLNHPYAVWVYEVAWHPDGRRLASRNSDYTVTIWDTEAQKASHILRGHRRKVQGLVWTSDGRALLTCGDDATVRIWDANSGREMHTLFGHSGPVRDVTVAPNGESLLTAGEDRSVKMWEIPQRDRKQSSLPSEARVRAVCWSPKGGRLALADGPRIVIHDRDLPAAPPLTLPGHDNQVRAVSWSPNDNMLASGSYDHTVRVWNAQDGQLLQTLEGHNRPVYAVAWHPRKPLLASGGGDNYVRIWDVEKGSQIQMLRVSGTISDLAWSPDGEFVAVANSSQVKPVVVFDAETFTSYMQFAPEVPRSALAVAWSPCGEKLAAGFAKWGSTENALYPTVHVFHLDGRTPTVELIAHNESVSAIDWSPDGSRLVSAARDGVIKVWDIASQRNLLTLQGVPVEVYDIAWNPDGSQIAAANYGGGVRIWDATDGYVSRSPSKLSMKLERRIAAGTASEQDLRIHARAAMRGGQWDVAARDFELLADRPTVDGAPPRWFVSNWWAIGPYPPRLEVPFGPEHDPDPFGPMGTLRTPKGLLREWRPAEEGSTGYLNLAPVVKGAEFVSAYAFRRIYSRKRQTVALLFGADDMSRIWLNGNLIHENQAARPAVPDDDVVMATLEPGWNRLLVKVVNQKQQHRFVLRLSDDPFTIARAWQQSDRWDEAIRHLDEAIVRNPEDAMLRVNRVRVAVEIGDQDLVDRCLHAALELSPDPIAGEQLQFYCQMLMAGADAAGDVFEDAFTASQRPSPELLALRFRRNTLNGRWAEAADDALQLIELDPTPDMVWLQAAPLLVLSGRINAYRDLCHRMMEQFADSEASTTNNRIAKVCLLSTEVTELLDSANEMATRSVEVREREDDPAVVWAYICKGLAEYRLGNFKDVLHWTAKAASRNPDGMILDHIQLLSAMAHFQLENQQESLDYYAQATNRLYSTCHHHDLQIREILRRECEALLFGEEYSHYAKARDLFWQRKYDEAIAEIEIAIKAYPSDRDMRTRRARWLMKAERFQEASDRFKELVAERELRSRNWHDLLVCLAMIGDEVQYKEYARLATQRYWRIAQAPNRGGEGRSRLTPVRSASFLEAVSMVSQACLVCPTDARNQSLVCRLADIPINTQNFSSLRSHFHFTKGLAEYRMGRPESAIRFLKASQDFNDSESAPLEVMNHLVLAMAYRTLGQEEEAERNRERAAVLSSRYLRPATYVQQMRLAQEWAKCAILQREAEKLFGTAD